jgi:hypothetical protein
VRRAHVFFQGKKKILRVLECILTLFPFCASSRVIKTQEDFFLFFACLCRHLLPSFLLRPRFLRYNKQKILCHRLPHKQDPQPIRMCSRLSSYQLTGVGARPSCAAINARAIRRRRFILICRVVCPLKLSSSISLSSINCLSIRFISTFSACGDDLKRKIKTKMSCAQHPPPLRSSTCPAPRTHRAHTSRRSSVFRDAPENVGRPFYGCGGKKLITYFDLNNYSAVNTSG